MTLIIGLNLSDKILLATDTRATKKSGTHEDDILKFAPLARINNHITPEKTDLGFIDVAVAGKTKLAKFVYYKIRADLQSGILSPDIRTLHKQLDERWGMKMADEWLTEGGRYWTEEDKIECCLLFGGTFPGRRKQIQRSKLDELIEIHQEYLETTYSKEIAKLPERTYNPDMMMTMIPEHFIDPQSDSSEELSTLPDSLVFCIQVKITQSEPALKTFKAAEWGEVIARGADGIKEDKLPKSLLAQCELMNSRTDNNTGHVIASIIKKFSKEFTSIGGPVLIKEILKDRSRVLLNSSETKVEDGELLLKDSQGEWSKPKSFLNYEDTDSSL